MKQGSKFKNWKTRFFILHDSVLQYKDVSSPKQYLNLVLLIFISLSILDDFIISRKEKLPERYRWKKQKYEK